MRTIILEGIKDVLVESSNVYGVGFDNGVLKVEYKNKSTYYYTPVTQDMFNELINPGTSVGSYINKNIKTNEKILCLKVRDNEGNK